MYIKEEIKNKGVLTAKSILSNKAYVAYVIYDEDGDWQFFNELEIEDNDIVLISLEQMLEIDNSLKYIEDVQKGTILFRKSKQSEWEILEN